MRRVRCYFCRRPATPWRRRCPACGSRAFISGKPLVRTLQALIERDELAAGAAEQLDQGVKPIVHGWGAVTARSAPRGHKPRHH